MTIDQLASFARDLFAVALCFGALWLVFIALPSLYSSWRNRQDRRQYHRDVEELLRRKMDEKID